MRQLLLIILSVGCLTAMPQTNETPKKNQAELMREMRLKQLTMSPHEFGQTPTPEFPRVCAIVMDWPIEATTITVVARNTGDASIYSTGTFGVFGGVGHEVVRNAAKKCVKTAEKHYGDAIPTKEYPYPKASRIRFYLVGFDDVRVIDAELESVRTGRDKCSDLYVAAQQVVTELRLITQQQQAGQRH